MRDGFFCQLMLRIPLCSVNIKVPELNSNKAQQAEKAKHKKKKRLNSESLRE